MRNEEVEKLAEAITPDPEKQKWLRRVIWSVSGQVWIIPDFTLKACGHRALRGMLRRRRNTAEEMLNLLKEAAGIKTTPRSVDNHKID